MTEAEIPAAEPALVAKVYGQPMLEMPQDLYIPPDALEVFLEQFEGPLDLLLYLIRKENISVLEIPMAKLTLQYLEYVELMRAQQLELAAEYLLMAAMLIEIKSRMLLPRPKNTEIEEDPRAELVFSPGFKDPRLAPAKKNLEKFLEGCIPPGRASDFNQALMDLGAMVCIPSRPRCSACPVLKFCSTKGDLPEKKPSVRKFREETWAVALVEREGRYLLHHNEAGGLLAGLWQFPKVVGEKNQGKDAGQEGLGKLLKKYLLDDFGLKVKMKTRLPEQEYFFTHIHALMKPYLFSPADPGNSPPPSKSLRWVKPSGFSRYPISTARRKIAGHIT